MSALLGIALSVSSLLGAAQAETKVAVAEAEASGYELPCEPVVVLSEDPDGRSWATWGTCTITHDPDTVAADDWWFRYVVRHEVCHIALTWKGHTDPWFRACETELAGNVGVALKYGDNPHGYPVSYTPTGDGTPPGTVRIDGMTTDAASLTPSTDGRRLCDELQEAKPWIDWDCESYERVTP